MQIQAVTFTEPWEVQLQDQDLDTSLAGRQCLVETEYSIVSAGTETAVLAGREAWAKLPFVPGYGAVGKILETAPQAGRFKAGDRIFYYGKHQSASIADGIMLAVPEAMDPKLAVVARLGQVSFTGPRVSDAEIGDYVAVIGMGLVGNICAQLFQIAGCSVIGIDIVQKRLDTARACGIDHALDSSRIDLAEAVRDVTDGQMCHTVVEATGLPQMALTATTLCAKLGDVVLLGTPRGEYFSNVTDLLRNVKLWGNCVTLKGGHEWRIPPFKDPNGHVKHSLERNLEQLLRFSVQGKLCLDPLISHVVPPSSCVQVYEALKNRNEDYLGVIFDWTGHENTHRGAR